MLYTDASTYALGATLAQTKENGKEHPIAYASRTMNKRERNYPITEQECLAVKWTVLRFKQYLGTGRKHTFYTDHQALQTFRNFKDPSPKLARWQEKIAFVNYDIKHRPGKKMQHADYLSRMPGDKPELQNVQELSEEESEPENIVEEYYISNGKGKPPCQIR